MSEKSDMQQSGKVRYQQLTIHEERELGRGNYGKVCCAFCDDLPCAAKLLNPKIFHFSTAELADSPSVQRFNQECELLCSISHPSLVQYIDAYIHPDTGQAVLLMELMDESLTSFLDRAINPISIHIQIDLCYDVVQALSYLHSNGIVHRDLTGKNVLVCGGSRAKVTDFGMMKMVALQQASNPHLKHMTMPDSSAYMPPEAFRYPPSYSDNIDIFSFGVVSLQIMTRQYPQPASSKVSEIDRRKFDINLVTLEHPVLPLVLSCLKDTDILRPPATQLCRKLKQLKENPLYEESKLKRDAAIQEVDRIRRELDEAQKENDELIAQLDSVRLENKQLSRLISKYSENISTNIPNVKPNGVPEDYLEIDDPSLLDDHLENQMDLSSPNPALWYHGSINRDTACLRLQSMLKPGAYLVRRSESEPGSFVLSFVDKQLRVFNYKIACRNGQYNVSSQSKKWFSSLQDLIGYYTRHSTVKQNQHLVIPVAPPDVIPLPSSQ